jgi:hypothetical protein
MIQREKYVRVGKFNWKFLNKTDILRYHPTHEPTTEN